MDTRQTLIIGGGVAGITCALELQRANIPYTLVSDTIGGRICYLAEYRMNFGAVFFMQSYTHAREILTPASPVLPSPFDLECHEQLGRGYGVASARVLSAAPQLARFLSYLVRDFKPRYERFKAACETDEFTEALRRNPAIAELIGQSADELIARKRFERAAQVLVSQFVYACTGSPISTLNALDYLTCALGIVDGATRFTFDPASMHACLEGGSGAVQIATVTSVERAEGLWQVTTAAHERLCAPNLVIATPADVARSLLAPVLGPYEIRAASELHAYKVAGHIKPAYAGHPLHLFDQSIPLINIGKRADGAYEVFTCTPLDLGLFFDDYTIEHRVDWPCALFTHPSIILDQDLGEGLYRIGDHNALGLEPAALSGVFAAHRIKER